jgi:hypothetical protein
MADHLAAPATPPTAPYQSFKAALRVFQQHGVPARVDHGALRKAFPRTTADNVLIALRFFELIDLNGAPTPALAAMKDALDTDAWAETLGAALQRCYGPVLKEGLEDATPAQLNQRLKAAFNLEAEACRRGATFLLAAALDAEIPVSRYLVAPPRSKGRLLPPKVEGAHESAALAARLLQKLPEFDPDWPDALKADWFQQFNELIQLLKPEDRPPRS